MLVNTGEALETSKSCCCQSASRFWKHSCKFWCGSPTAKVSFGTPVEEFDMTDIERTFDEAPQSAGNGAPDYSDVDFHSHPGLDVQPGGSATDVESGGGYSG